MDVMTKDLKVMDATAIAFCRDNKIPIVVFDMSKPGSLRAIVEGGRVGTIVHDAVSACDAAPNCSTGLPANAHVLSALSLKHGGYAGLGDRRHPARNDRQDEQGGESRPVAVPDGAHWQGGTPAIAERLTVDYFGAQVAVQQLASIQVPEARQLLIRTPRSQHAEQHRTGHHRLRPRCRPEQRRRLHSSVVSTADRGTPQGVRQSRQAHGRGGARCCAQRTARGS